MSSAAATSPPAALKAKCIDLLLSYVAQPKEEYLASAGDLASVFVSEGCQVADIAELQLEACWAVGQQQPEMSFREANEWVLPFFMELFIGFERGMAAAASERDRVVAALAQSELNYRTIFDNSRSGIVILDTDGFVQLCNDAIRTMLGYGHGELEGRHIRSFTHADEAELIEGHLTALLAGASIPKVSRMRLMRRDGGSVKAECSASAIKREDGAQHVMLTYSDLTQRAIAERALRDSEMRFRNVVERLGSGIVLVVEGRIQLVNESMRRMLGYSSAEISRLQFEDIFVDEDLPRALEILRALQAGQLNHHRGSYTLVNRDGERLKIEATVTRIQADSSDSEGEHVDESSHAIIDPPAAGFVVEVRDVTQRPDGERRAGRLRRAPAP